MHGIQALSLLALAGTILAAPAPVRNQERQNVHVVYETVVHTVVVGAQGYQGHRYHRPTQAPAPVQPQPQPTEQPVFTPTPEPKPAPKPTPSPEPAPAPTPEPAPAPAPAPPSTGGYMDTVNEWRQKLKLNPLQHDDQLEANALKTAQDGNGQMVHELNPGSFAQVLAPGQPSEFEHCFVGGWLCEKPSMDGMDGVCSTASSGWMYTSTGHADILTNPDYKKIGCANAGGIWGCDLA